VELGAELREVDDDFLPEFGGDLGFFGCLEGEGEIKVAGGLD